MQGQREGGVCAGTGREGCAQGQRGEGGMCRDKGRRVQGQWEVCAGTEGGVCAGVQTGMSVRFRVHASTMHRMQAVSALHLVQMSNEYGLICLDGWTVARKQV